MGEVKNIANDVLSACISSAASEPMILKEPYGKDFRLHTQLHVMLNAPSAFGKSSILDSLPEGKRVDLLTYTLPGIIGSITREGAWVEGLIMKAAGKTLVVDEHHNLPESAKNALLKLTEQQKAERNLGYKVTNPPRPVNRRMLKAGVDGNYIRISNVRFSSLFTGIYQSKKSINDKAFASRFMHLCFMVGEEDRERIMMGFNPFEVTYTHAIGGHVFEDYERFVKVFNSTLKVCGNLGRVYSCQFEFLRRGMLHFCRLFSWASGSNSTIVDWEKYIPYIPFFAYNMLSSTLTLSEYEVLNLSSSGLSQEKIAQSLSVSQPYVSRVLTRLGGMGLGYNYSKS